ncbi:coenzyme q10 biosynthesis protein [Dichotomocladium elegans]|nr:coenzyme q10 biosynthesis protein [Dichotomocladium elegans]
MWVRRAPLMQPRVRLMSAQSSSATTSSTTGSFKQTRQLAEEEKRVLDPMIRVDQSGEVNGRDKKLHPILQEIFDRLVGEMALLRPLWNIAGFAVGAGTALMDKEAAMACTEAVETVTGNHSEDHLCTIVKMAEANPDLKELGKTIAKFRDDELEHYDIAVEHDARRAPFHSVLKAVIMQGCKSAIWVAERV